MNENTASELIRYAPAGLPQGFRPFAHYDKHLDCIRVQVFDCSFTEKRLNRFLTVLHANHKEGNISAGFNIKGVRALFERMGLSMKGVYKLTELIDLLVQLYPDAAIEAVKRQFRPVLGEENVEVVFA